MTETLLKIGELAARAEVSARTVDYYTTMGLLAPAQRSAGNYRLYSPADVERIHLIQRLEAQGIPLEEIAAALSAGPRDINEVLARIDDDLKSLQTVTESAPVEVHGLLNIIATRVHSLIAVAMQLPPDLPL
ncbi:MerR family transcriptional regulator [Nocardia sp. NPDC050712]|uniref:helix-turn-helix domain-containing protein n=1 Tax=Nocardia sp. NPDC050712 TaxID=3155518 RepID=UPI003403334C